MNTAVDPASNANASIEIIGSRTSSTVMIATIVSPSSASVKIGSTTLEMTSVASPFAFRSNSAVFRCRWNAYGACR